MNYVQISACRHYGYGNSFYSEGAQTRQRLVAAINVLFSPRSWGSDDLDTKMARRDKGTRLVSGFWDDQETAARAALYWSVGNDEDGAKAGASRQNEVMCSGTKTRLAYICSLKKADARGENG